MWLTAIVVPPANGPDAIAIASSLAWLRFRLDLKPIYGGAAGATGAPAGIPPTCWWAAGSPAPVKPVRVSRQGLVAHELGFQRNVKLTRWGSRQMCAYSMCRADTGGLTSKLSR
jgi:hypothetical protein